MLNELVPNWLEHQLIVLCDYDLDLPTEIETSKIKGKGHSHIHENIRKITNNNYKTHKRT